MKRSALFGTLVLVGMLGMDAAAQNQPGTPGQRPGMGPGGPSPMMTRLDANADGRITWEEASKRHADMFAVMDQNGDGALTQDELTAMRGHGRATGGRRAMRFEQMDTDGDGKVTTDEFKQAHRAMFDTLDHDGDGVLAAEEVPARRGRP